MPVGALAARMLRTLDIRAPGNRGMDQGMCLGPATPRPLLLVALSEACCPGYPSRRGGAATGGLDEPERNAPTASDGDGWHSRGPDTPSRCLRRIDPGHADHDPPHVSCRSAYRRTDRPVHRPADALTHTDPPRADGPTGDPDDRHRRARDNDRSPGLPVPDRSDPRSHPVQTPRRGDRTDRRYHRRRGHVLPADNAH